MHTRAINSKDGCGRTRIAGYVQTPCGFSSRAPTPASVFPVLDCKYSPNQPRVPAGNSDGGQWTDGGDGGGSALRRARPMGDIDVGDPSEVGNLGLFEIAPRERDNSDYAQLAGDVPGIGHNEGPPLDEPPEIPRERPKPGGDLMKFIRQASAWVERVGRYSPYADVFFGALKQIDETNAITGTIRSASDPPMSLEELQDRVGPRSESDYHDHHIAEEKAARDAGFSEKLIQGSDNLVRIPILKHIDISSYYSTKTDQPDGSRISPRESLKNKSFEERRQFGLKVLRDKGVLK